jgi:thiamine biosynthesis protein ThiI
MKQPRSFVALLSSGLDSPIAAYLMLKKGYDGVLLSFKIADPENDAFTNKIHAIAQHLHGLTNRSLTLYIVNHEQVLQEFMKKASRKLTCVLCKSYMLYSAYLLAKNTKSDFIVNGDIIGEQASQTPDNLYVIQSIMHDLPVIRPLIGFEKKDVLHLSHKLGFYEFSKLPDTPCTYNPKYPETRGDLSEVKINQQIVEIKNLAATYLENAQKLIVG